MSMAIANPDELINFANALEQYIRTLDEETGKLSAAFETLGESWRDEKRTQFEDTYHQLLAVLAAFKSNSSEQIPYLRIMAQDLKTYLGR